MLTPAMVYYGFSLSDTLWCKWKWHSGGMYYLRPSSSGILCSFGARIKWNNNLFTLILAHNQKEPIKTLVKDHNKSGFDGFMQGKGCEQLCKPWLKIGTWRWRSCDGEWWALGVVLIRMSCHSCFQLLNLLKFRFAKCAEPKPWKRFVMNYRLLVD